MSWYGKHRTAFAGDSFREQLRDVDKQNSLLGVYEEGYFLLLPDIVKGLLGKIPTVFKERIVGAKEDTPHVMLEVPAPLAVRLLPIKAWLRENHSSLRNLHVSQPPTDAAAHAVGYYSPTLIGIGKKKLKHEIPQIAQPDKLKVWRQEVENTTPRLIKLAVQDPLSLTAPSS